MQTQTITDPLSITLLYRLDAPQSAGVAAVSPACHALV